MSLSNDTPRYELLSRIPGHGFSLVLHARLRFVGIHPSSKLSSRFGWFHHDLRRLSDSLARRHYLYGRSMPLSFYVTDDDAYITLLTVAIEHVKAHLWLLVRPKSHARLRVSWLSNGATVRIRRARHCADHGFESVQNGELDSQFDAIYTGLVGAVDIEQVCVRHGQEANVE